MLDFLTRLDRWEKRIDRVLAPPTKKTEKEVRVEAPTTDLETWASDFLGFTALLDIVPKEGGARQKLRPNAIQSAFEVSRSGRDIVLKPRQVGLTTWELARDVWFFLTRKGANVVIVCQSDKDDDAIKKIAEKVRIMFESLGSAGVIIPGLDASTTKWLIPSRDACLRIIGAGASAAAAKKKGRGGSIQRLHVTELAFFEFASDTMNALEESLSPEAEVVYESTANGAAGWFYESCNAARSKNSSFRFHFFRWLAQKEYALPLKDGERIEPENDHERAIVKAGATPEQLKWYRKKVADKKSQDLVDQEYPIDEESCWITPGRVFFNKERSRALLADTKPPIKTISVGQEGAHGVIRIWKVAQPGRTYLISGDPSEGIGGDPGAAPIFDHATGEHVATLHGQFPPWEFARLCAGLGRGHYLTRDEQRHEQEFAYGSEDNPALIVIERNNHGHTVLRALAREQKYKNIYVGTDERPGWVNSEVSRAAALSGLYQAHFDQDWSSPERETIAEMLTFVVTASGKAEAQAGAFDDLVLAHAIGWDVLSKPVERRHRHEVNDYDETDDS